MTDKYLNFDEYIRQGEPDEKKKASIWQTAIGLQAVDGLKTSDYLKETARKHIEGKINIDEARDLIKTYYQSKTRREPDEENMQEADKVSANITKILSSETFDFSEKGYVALHRRIFEGVFKHAGKVRDYDITKKEWVLDGDTVNYLNWEDLHRAIEFDLEQERQYSYKRISQDEMITHITKFVSGLWQIHAFGEGNTRTTAVFIILYLRHIGFKVNNDMFAQHSWYFRNALVRANYKSAVKGIDYSPVYLERFFRNLLLGEQWDLRNRYLHIHPTKEWREQPNLTPTSTPLTTPTTTPASSLLINLKSTSKICTSNKNIIELVRVIGNDELSIKQLMDFKKLKERKNFVEYHLEPALKDKFVRRKYPDRPNHPRQKYMLTTKGLTLYHELTIVQ
ncbi:MAG: Fic family protein [Bacteroidales bacterium]|nr:Fic family protein [Bacteroidales bacterium]